MNEGHQVLSQKQVGMGEIRLPLHALPRLSLVCVPPEGRMIIFHWIGLSYILRCDLRRSSGFILSGLVHRLFQRRLSQYL